MTSAANERHGDGPEDQDDGRRPANQGPTPPEPEDTPDTGEGTLAPQMGDEDIEDERGRHA